MIKRENLQYSLKNLLLRPGRSFLTILSIFVGIATIFIFISFGWGLYSYVDSFATGSTADKFIVEGRGGGAPGTSSVLLSDSDIDAVEKTRGVIDVAGLYFAGAEVKQNDVIKYVYAMGFDPDDLELIEEGMTVELLRGRHFEDGLYDVIAGYNYQFDDTILPKGLGLNDKVEVNGIKLQIVGFYDELGNPADDSNLYMSEETYLKLFPDEDSYSMLLGRGEISELETTLDRIEKNLRNDRNEEEGKETFTVTSFLEQLEAFSASLNFVIAFIVLIAFISVIVSAINTANTMVTSVLERVQEIGVLKSIGARNSDIFRIFLIESALLGFVAGVIGVLLGWFISASAGAALDASGWGFLQPKINAVLFIGLISFATIVGAISGVIPAVDASKKKPVDALRAE